MVSSAAAIPGEINYCYFNLPLGRLPTPPVFRLAFPTLSSAAMAHEGDGGGDDDDDDDDDDENDNRAISPSRRSWMPDDGAVADVSPASTTVLHGAKTAATPSPTMPRPRWHGVDPPRPPRDGFDSRFWKWRSRSTKSTSEMDAGDFSSACSPPSASAPGWHALHLDAAAPPPLSPFLSESAHVLSLQNPPGFAMPYQSAEKLVAPPPSFPEWPPRDGRVDEDASQRTVVRVPSAAAASAAAVSSSTTSASSWHLHGRRWLSKARREVEFKFRPRNRQELYAAKNVDSPAAHQKYRSAFHTTDHDDDEDAVLPAATDGLRRWLRPNHSHHHSVGGSGRSATRPKDDSGTVRVSRKLFGRAPWHRRGSAGSFGDSARDLLQRGTPPATPMSTYTMASTGLADSFKSAISQFPGGEAVRVSTPPLDEDTADGKPRGFFTCTTPPSDTQASPAPPPSTSPILAPSPRPGIHGAAFRGSSLSAPTREWWEVSPQRALRRGPRPLAAGPVASRGAGAGGGSNFQFDVPEHLPNSPLCPAHSRHKSGGTGVCVYHGRGKAKSLLRDADRVSAAETSLSHGYESAMP
ncbi:hypothetical protein HRG_002064 [Hirsutella rhossiliensis]|uniref:Uncharacterized protein n=1 Tax=Hirsutella rhossiliensis TaxID=111463 RepID=A0A9P8N4E9_9HYPO|nr:uncharacterized protein HRG_02064 [Hirsutella rhossiliensis]KAH0966655.1 hypothetical protein HRG_02064 [Hirsutella rhossiliensis]